MQTAVTNTSDRVEWVFEVGQSFTPDLSTIKFDMGVEGLPLSLDVLTSLTLTAEWNLKLGFGISLKHGFYLVLADDQLSVSFNLNAATLSANGRLFFLDANVKGTRE